MQPKGGRMEENSLATAHRTVPGGGGSLVPPWGTLDIACGGGKSEPGDAGQDPGTRTTSCHGSSVAGEDYGEALSTDSCKLCRCFAQGSCSRDSRRLSAHHPFLSRKALNLPS